MRKTKIICTLGPSTEDDKVLKQLMIEGMNVARFNFSHGDHAQHEKNLNRVKRIREELGLPIAALLDTKGPEIRVKTFKDGKVEELVINGRHDAAIILRAQVVIEACVAIALADAKLIKNAYN